jgi:hypothetical protein
MKLKIRESFRCMVSRANFVKLEWKLLYYYHTYNDTTQRQITKNIAVKK